MGDAPRPPEPGDGGRPPGAPPTGRVGSLRIGQTPLELARTLDTWIESSILYTRRKRTTFRTASTLLKVATLALSAASTIILGLQDLDFWASVGFALVALVTLVSAVEQFFNWRSRWVLMEEQLYRLYRLRQTLALRIGMTTEQELTFADVESIYERYNRIWESTSEQWLQHRRTESGSAG